MQCAQEEILGNQKHLRPNLTEPWCDEAGFTHAGFFCLNCIGYLQWSAHMWICRTFWIPQKPQLPHAPRSGDLQEKQTECPRSRCGRCLL